MGRKEEKPFRKMPCHYSGKFHLKTNTYSAEGARSVLGLLNMKFKSSAKSELKFFRDSITVGKKRQMSQIRYGDIETYYVLKVQPTTLVLGVCTGYNERSYVVITLMSASELAAACDLIEEKKGPVVMEEHGAEPITEFATCGPATDEDDDDPRTELYQENHEEQMYPAVREETEVVRYNVAPVNYAPPPMEDLEIIEPAHYQNISSVPGPPIIVETANTSTTISRKSYDRRSSSSSRATDQSKRKFPIQISAAENLYLDKEKDDPLDKNKWKTEVEFISTRPGSNDAYADPKGSVYIYVARRKIGDRGSSPYDDDDDNPMPTDYYFGENTMKGMMAGPSSDYSHDSSGGSFM